jgi:hypothetical protein
MPFVEVTAGAVRKAGTVGRGAAEAAVTVWFAAVVVRPAVAMVRSAAVMVRDAADMAVMAVMADTAVMADMAGTKPQRLNSDRPDPAVTHGIGAVEPRLLD